MDEERVTSVDDGVRISEICGCLILTGEEAIKFNEELHDSPFCFVATESSVKAPHAHHNREHLPSAIRGDGSGIGNPLLSNNFVEKPLREKRKRSHFFKNADEMLNANSTDHNAVDRRNFTNFSSTTNQIHHQQQEVASGLHRIFAPCTFGWRRKCAEILLRISSVPSGSYFLLQVDPVKDKVFDYEDVVDAKSDFTSVARQLPQLTRPSQFAHAVRQIYVNACKYHHPDPVRGLGQSKFVDVYTQALRNQMLFDSLSCELPTDTQVYSGMNVDSKADIEIADRVCEVFVGNSVLATQSRTVPHWGLLLKEIDNNNKIQQQVVSSSSSRGGIRVIVTKRQFLKEKTAALHLQHRSSGSGIVGPAKSVDNISIADNNGNNNKTVPPLRLSSAPVANVPNEEIGWVIECFNTFTEEAKQKFRDSFFLEFAIDDIKQIADQSERKKRQVVEFTRDVAKTQPKSVTFPFPKDDDKGNDDKEKAESKQKTTSTPTDNPQEEVEASKPQEDDEASSSSGSDSSSSEGNSSDSSKGKPDDERNIKMRASDFKETAVCNE